MIHQFWNKYLFLFMTSFFASFVTYAVSYEVQSRIYRESYRFSRVDKSSLGVWKYIVLAPRNLKDPNSVFCITVDGEKCAVIGFMVDMILIPIVSACISQFKYIVLYFFIQVVLVAIVTDRIYEIRNRIRELPLKIVVTEQMLEKYIRNYCRKLRKEYPETDYLLDRIVDKKRDKWEVVETISIRVIRNNGALIQDIIIAQRRYSRYYWGSEITIKRQL